MKTILIKSTFAILLASLASIGFAGHSHAGTTKITVNGMVCAFCAQGIEKRLSQMPATKSVFVDLKSKIVAVESKDGMSLDNKAIAHEITEAGYDVVKTEESKQSVAEIKASLKAKK
jgi:copper chaperone CopZ